jgi:tape measure domain-containing protein
VDVDFQLRLKKDPKAKGMLRSWEQSLLASQKRVEAGVSQSFRRQQSAQLAALKSVEKRKTSALLSGANSRRQILNRELRTFRDNRAKEVALFRKGEASKRDELTKTGRHASKVSARVQRSGGGKARPAAGGFGAGAAGGAFGGALLGIGARFLAPVAAGYAAYRGATSSLSIAMEQKDALLRFEALTGSAEKAREAMDRLREVSLISGVQRGSLEQAMSTMLGFGVSLDSAMAKSKEFSAIAMGDSLKVGRLALAFAQASANGRLMAEELNQMIETGFNPLREMSRQTGKSILELREDMRDGAISIEMLSDAFTGATSEGGQFGSALTKLQESTTIAAGVMKSELEQLQGRIGRKLEALYSLSIDVGQLTINATNATLDVVDSVGREAANKKTASLREQAMDLTTAELLARVAATSNNRGVGGLGSAALGVFGMMPAGVRQEMDRDLALTELLRRSELEKSSRSSAEAAAEAAEARKEAEEKALEARKEALQVQGKELVHAAKLNSMRKKGATEELRAREKALSVAQKAQEQAEKSLMSARERFGAMSTEEQNKALQTLVRARRGGPKALSLEDISTLQTLGTGEAGAFASAALNRRASASFGVDMSTARGRQMAALRSSLFEGERQAVDRTRREAVRVNSQVKQQVEFVAQFDQTASQLADKVMKLNKEALDEQMADVVRMLTPLMDQYRADRTRNAGQVPGRAR